MAEMIIAGGILTAPAQPQSLFSSFLAYIDRGPQTTRAYTNNLKQFAAWMKYTGTEQPARADIILYRDWLTAEHDAIRLAPEAPEGWAYRTSSNGTRQRMACKPNTVKQYMQSVKQFFMWAAAEGLYQNIAANVHSPKVTDIHRKDGLSALDVQRIESSIEARAEQKTQAAAQARKDTAGRQQRSTEQGKRLAAIYSLAVNAGLRTVEISRANVRDLEEKNGCACLYVWGKGHAEPDAKKPLAPEVYQTIKDYLSARSDRPTGASPLFVSTGNRSRGKRIDPTTISKWIKAAMQAAGYNSERITAHSLRHTTGENIMIVTGDNIYRTQQYMRHSSPKTTEIYLNANKAEEDAELARLLYAHYHGASEASTPAQKIQSAMQKMNPAQLAQLAEIASAMVAR